MEYYITFKNELQVYLKMNFRNNQWKKKQFSENYIQYETLKQSPETSETKNILFKNISVSDKKMSRRQ